MRRRIEYGCTAIMAIMLMFFAILGIMAVVLTVSAKSPQHVPDSLNMGTYSVVYDPDLRIPVSADWVLKTVRDLLTDTICQSKYFQND